MGKDRVVEVRGFGRDVTEKGPHWRRCAKVEQRYRELVENIADIIYVTNNAW